MASVKWIKLNVDMFDDEKIKIIQSMPEGDALLIVWVKLILLAGKTNEGGYIYISENMPYTDEMLSVVVNKPLNIIRLAIETFTRLGMIENDEKGIYLVNFEKHQSLDKLEQIREQTRLRVAKHREKVRNALIGSNERICAYCGNVADTIDHLIPKVKGGVDEEWNIVPSCKSCNSSKKDKDLCDFLNDSIKYNYQYINHELVQNNDKIMKLIKYDAKNNKYVTVTLRNAIDKDIDKDIDIDNKKENIKEKKNKYGFYKHVLLTPTEYNKIKDEYINYEELIKFLDEYIEMKGYKAKNHYLCIKKWVVDAVKERNVKKRNDKDYDRPAWLDMDL